MSQYSRQLQQYFLSDKTKQQNRRTRRRLFHLRGVNKRTAPLHILLQWKWVNKWLIDEKLDQEFSVHPFQACQYYLETYEFYYYRLLRKAIHLGINYDLYWIPNDLISFSQRLKAEGAIRNWDIAVQKQERKQLKIEKGNRQITKNNHRQYQGTSRYQNERYSYASDEPWDATLPRNWSQWHF